MAKKKNEEPVYPSAPLVVSKDKFVELLQEQIEKGKELLDIKVPLKTQQNPFHGYSVRNNDRVEYDEVAEKDFFAKFNRWHDRNKEIYRSSFEVPNSIYYHDYESQVYPPFIIVDIVKDYKDDISRLINQMQTDIERVDLMRCELPQTAVSGNSINSNEKVREGRKVFIVHGHDTNIRNEVELFVRSIGYEPIILCKRADKGNTIIEKIEREAKDVCYAIVIYTSCDLGKEKDADELLPRARQNVVFEHGFMCAHLGRPRVVALLEKGVEKPGDLQGIIYKELDDRGMWKYDIAKEMDAVGLSVDFNKIG